ncbi:MAG: hypothetical protein H7X99_10215 [Saprospiraceae bacterium]|nr:hypothetical protein [Saprospiraceae bacterium]
MFSSYLANGMRACLGMRSTSPKITVSIFDAHVPGRPMTICVNSHLHKLLHHGLPDYEKRWDLLYHLIL